MVSPGAEVIVRWRTNRDSELVTELGVRENRDREA